MKKKKESRIRGKIKQAKRLDKREGLGKENSLDRMDKEGDI